MVHAPGLFEGPLAIRIVAVLLIFYALYFAASLLVPIVCAALLGVMLAPLVSGLERVYVPRPIAATLVVLGRLARNAHDATSSRSITSASCKVPDPPNYSPRTSAAR